MTIRAADLHKSPTLAALHAARIKRELDTKKKAYQCRMQQLRDAWPKNFGDRWGRGVEYLINRKEMEEAFRKNPALGLNYAVDEAKRYRREHFGYEFGRMIKFIVGNGMEGTYFHRPPTLTEIAQEICAKYKVSMIDLKSVRRHHYLTLPRKEFCYRARNETTKSLTMIGKFLGGRDHTTVHYSIQSYEGMQ